MKIIIYILHLYRKKCKIFSKSGAFSSAIKAQNQGVTKGPSEFPRTITTIEVLRTASLEWCDLLRMVRDPAVSTKSKQHFNVLLVVRVPGPI